MHSKVKQAPQQRFDLIDFLTQQCNVENEFSILNNQLFTQGVDGGFVLKGMEINVDGGSDYINATLEEIAIVSSDGTMHRRLATETQLKAGTNNGMVATGTNFVEAEIYSVGDGNDNRVFWDALVDSEFTQATDTITRQDVRLIANPVGFSTGTDAKKRVRVAIVITNGGVVERIHDNYGNVVYAGSPTNPNFEENKLFRLNDDDSDGDSERFDFGSPRTDNSVKSLKNAFDALATQFKDLIGDGKTIGSNTNNWFEQHPIQLFALAADRATLLSGGEGRLWDLGTTTLSWDTDLNVRQAGEGGSGGVANIPAGSTNLLTSNGLILYVELDRDATTSYAPTLQVVDFTNWFDNHTQDRFVIAHRSDDKIYFADGQIIEDSSLEIIAAISNVDDVDANNPAKVYFHTFGSDPDQILMYLYGQRFHQAFYTEIGSHNHGNTLSINGTDLGSHSHSHNISVNGTNLGTHGHNIYGENPPGETASVDMTNNPGAYLSGSITPIVGPTGLGTHGHGISGGVIGTNLGSHGHGISGSVSSIGVTPAIGSVRTSGTAKEWFDDLQIIIDGVDRTAVLLTQASLAKFGDGTNTHQIVTSGVELDITSYITGLGEHNVEFTLSGVDNGGRLRSVIYQLNIP